MPRFAPVFVLAAGIFLSLVVTAANTPPAAPVEFKLRPIGQVKKTESRTLLVLASMTIPMASSIATMNNKVPVVLRTGPYWALGIFRRCPGVRAVSARPLACFRSVTLTPYIIATV